MACGTFWNQAEQWKFESNYKESVELIRIGAKEPLYESCVLIDREIQVNDIPQDVLVDTCVPCVRTGCKGKWGCLKFTWAVLRSHTFTMALETFAILFGVIKELLDWRKGRPRVHLMSSIIETVVTCVVVVIRCGSQWYLHSCHRDRSRVNRYATRRITRCLCIHTAISVLLVSFASLWALGLGLCHHLGWTLFTNQLTILLTEVTNGLLTEMITEQSYRLNNDQHKAIIIEGLDLLGNITTPYFRQELCTHYITTVEASVTVPNYFIKQERTGFAKRKRSHSM